MNAKLRKKSKNYFEKDFCKLMNNAGFEKTTENVRNHRAIKLGRKRNYLISEQNYHATIFQPFISHRNEKKIHKQSTLFIKIKNK